MKLSVAVAGEEAPASAFVVWRGFRESIEKAAKFGYHGIELALREASEVDPAWLSKALTRHGLSVSCISTGQVFAVLGLYFTHPDPSVREKTVTVFKDLISLAADFGGLVNVGRARGYYVPDRDPAETEALFIEACRALCDYAEPKGVDIIVEPVNRYEINFINSVDEGADIVARVERDNIGLMPDVFHMNIEDVSIGNTLAANSQWVKYIHLADSNRWAPGEGHLDFDDVFRGLRTAGFDGWGSIEILPKPDPDTAAQRAARTMLPLIDRYNSGEV